MTRVLPLITLALWLTFAEGGRVDHLMPPALDPMPLIWLLNGICAIVLGMAIWARLLLNAYRFSTAAIPTRGFQYGMLAARIAVVAWFGVCLFSLGFGGFIDALLWPLAQWSVAMPGLILATSPVLLGWFGLWWAAYPIERAVREQYLLVLFNAGITPHAPPGLKQTLSTNFRMQVLFVVAPLLVVGAFRDIVAVSLQAADIPMTGRIDLIVFVVSITAIFIASPELLIRVLHARPLAPSPLRDRLEEIARKLGLRYRDILIWHTSHGIGNAAVIGPVPAFRYILLTDLLIETLDQRQLEAVFAHEAGHVKHRHLLWYAVFAAIFILTLSGPADTLFRAACEALGIPRVALFDLLVAIAVIAAYLLLFGMLSRLFEKQADVYAARSMESLASAQESRASPMTTSVGAIGAESLVSALARVAEINHMPIHRPPPPRNVLSAIGGRVFEMFIHFMHPSIPDRVDHLRDLATHHAYTARFDRKVVIVMLGMLFALVTLATWVLVESLKPGATPLR